MQNVTWIGLGHMGEPLSAHLVEAGFTVTGFDINPDARQAAAERGVKNAESMREAVAESDFVFTMLPSGDHVKTALTGPEGAFSYMREGAIAVDCSTIGIAAAQELYSAAKDRNLGFVDGPVSGGVQGAVNGDLTLMLGGDLDHVELVRPLLKSFGDYVVHVGPSGDGQAMKVANNAMLGINMAAACEASVFAERLGLDPKAFYEVVTRSSGDNWPFRHWFPLPGVVPTSPSSHDYEPGFMIDLLVKDLRLATELASELGSPLATAETAHELFAAASAEGKGESDCTALAVHLTEQST